MDFQQRKLLARKGLAELESWLSNLIRHGLGDPQVKSYVFWDSQIARLIDAELPGLAEWLREISGLPMQGGEWVERMLEQLAKIHLLIESFKRFEQLPVEIQMDMRFLLGWEIELEELNIKYGLLDHWLTIGKQVTNGKDFKTQRLWLHGQQCNLSVLIHETVSAKVEFQTQLDPGQAVYAEMIYFPSSSFWRGFILRQTGNAKERVIISGSTISNSVEQYSIALAQNPWLTGYFFILDAVVPTRFGSEWIVREDNGTYLPIAPSFEHRWSLLALGGGHPILVAGEWDGQFLHPMSAIHNGRFVNLRAL